MATCSQQSDNTSTRPLARRGTSSWSLLVIVLAILALITAAAWLVSSTVPASSGEEPLLGEVTRGPFEHIVIEQGEVESSNNVEIRCEVKSRSGGGGPSSTILDVIPEGTHVDQDDWLITLDSSSLEEERGRQRITVNTSEAIMIQAEAIFKTSVISKKEYLKGIFVHEEKMILNEIYVAEDALKRAGLVLKSGEGLLAKGLLTDLQLEAQRFAVAKSKNELDAARIKLNVLREYTREKMLTQLESDIKAADVRWQNEKDSHVEELRKLQNIEEQIAKCTIVAPGPGVVVYANVQSSRSNSEFVVEPGAAVRERQIIVRLPDPKRMQVNAKINESRINLIRPGQIVAIRIDAFGDEYLQGEVVKVNKYAEPGHWWRSTAKEYATYIKIFDPPPQIRSGLTAENRIYVERRDNALQIPVQAVYEYRRHTYCLVKRSDQWDTRPITVLSTNGKTAAILVDQNESLSVSDQVVLNPKRFTERFNLPDLPETPPAEVVAKD